MARIAYETDRFREDFRRASKRDQERVQSFIRKFGEDATRDGTRLKTPATALDARVKTARVDQGLRAVLIEVGDGDYALLRVMEHEAAYRWAGKVRPDVSAFNGLPRLLVMPEEHHSPVVAAAHRPDRTDPFDHRRDRDFTELGVPDWCVPLLRNAPDADAATAFADGLGDADPLVGIAIHRLLDKSFSLEEIYAELLSLEGAEVDGPRSDGAWSGADVAPQAAPAIDTSDLGAALSRPGAQERFRVVGESEELIAALQGDFAAWRVFLHPLQRKAAYECAFAGPARVSGGAGTGKTVVLVHRVKALLERQTAEEPARILVTTFTPHLRGDLMRLLAQLVGSDAAGRVDIRTVDGLARDLHQQMSGQGVRELNGDEELRVWREIAARYQRSATFLRNEYVHVVLARGVRSREEYEATSRAGRGVRLTTSERGALWPAFADFEARTRGRGRCSTLQLTESVAALLERLPASLFDHVLVDEAQDLHASQWRLLRSVVAPGPDDLFIVGDAFQRIYGHSVSLRSLGIETRGRSIRLRRNYRTTHEIIGWALGVIGDEVVIDVDDLGTDLSGYHSVRHGPKPTFVAYPGRADELVGVTRRVQGWLTTGYAPEAIAVAVRTKGELAEVVRELQRAGVPAGQLGAKGRLDACVNVATMHRLKGLEYPCVAVTGLAAERVPPPGAVCSSAEDHTQHQKDVQTERSLIYVAASRARDELAITWHGEPTSLITTGVRQLAAAAT